MYIKTLEGDHHASVGDYIIKGVNGELYPCKPDIFEGRTPDFLILQDRFAVKIEKDEPYVGDYGLTVSDNEDECEFTVAINFCPICGRKLTEE